MTHQLIPPREFAPPSVKHLPVEKRIELWADLVDACDAFLIASLKERVGPGGDWKQAYREWNERRLAEREKAQIQFLENLARREAAGGN